MGIFKWCRLITGRSRVDTGKTMVVKHGKIMVKPCKPSPIAPDFKACFMGATWCHSGCSGRPWGYDEQTKRMQQTAGESVTGDMQQTSANLRELVHYHFKDLMYLTTDWSSTRKAAVELNEESTFTTNKGAATHTASEQIKIRTF